MPRPRSLTLLLLGCIALGNGCVSRRGAERYATPAAPPPLPGIAFDRPAVVHLYRSAYIRVQDRPGSVVRGLSVVPLAGDFFENFATTDVKTIDYGPAFDEKARTFLGRFCPQCRSDGADIPYQVELSLPRSAYNRRTQELRQVLIFRITGRFGAVIYRKVVTSTVRGDVVAHREVLERGLDQGFALLADALQADHDKIVARTAFHETSIQQLETVLLAKSRSLATTWPGHTAADADRRFAVIIGVSSYDDPRVTQLHGAANDAVAMFQALTAPGNGYGFRPDHVVLLVDKLASKSNVDEALTRWLAHGTRPGDTVLVYFSGHGVYSEDAGEGGRKKEKFFLPVDYDKSPGRSPYDTAIPMQDIVDYFQHLTAGYVVMIFDACHAQAAQLDDQTDELRRFAQVKAYNRLNAVVASAKANQLSWEDGSRGIFTRELTRGLEGNADADGDGHVSLAETARFLVATVSKASVAAGFQPQEPVWETNHLDQAGEFPLAAFRR